MYLFSEMADFPAYLKTYANPISETEYNSAVAMGGGYMTHLSSSKKQVAEVVKSSLHFSTLQKD